MVDEKDDVNNDALKRSVDDSNDIDLETSQLEKKQKTEI